MNILYSSMKKIRKNPPIFDIENDFESQNCAVIDLQF